MDWMSGKHMDIQSVFNEYKAVACMSSNFVKSEDQCSQTIKMQPMRLLRTICISMK